MTVNALRLNGLVAATFTPMGSDGSIDVEVVPRLVEFLIQRGIAGLYVLGSTGEGPSLTADERQAMAEAFVRAAAGRLPVIVQVGSESLAQSRLLALHAQEIGADAVSAVSTVYFKPDSVPTLVASMAEIASGAPALPFYYYHIPMATGVTLNTIEFLRLGGERIPTLCGIKFTSPAIDEYQRLVEFDDGRYEILYGLDEMLLPALSVGARAAVGSTYNFAAPIYRRVLAAFEAGDPEKARRQQARAQAVIQAFVRYGARASQKAIMAFIGQDCGPSRLPVPPFAAERSEALRGDLQALGFFDWLSEES